MQKKITKYILSLLMACSVLIAPQSTTIQEVQAVESDYPLHCDARYEVSIVNNSGTFDNVGCYSSFSEAQKVMWDSGDDAVVRHSSSYSPTGIIAMNSGVAISYPMRGGSTTLTIDAANGGGKTTYVTRHREMTSASTETYNGNGDGRVYVQLNGFAGYVSLKLVDLVPMKYITNGISIKLGGKDTTSENEQPFRVTVKQAHYRVEQNGNYKDLVYYAYSGYNSTEYRIVVGKAADWMSVGSTYYSWDNYRFYNDRKFTNIAGTYYNYYQFLPIRSQSNISADVYNRFLSNLGYTKKPNSSDFNTLARNETQLWNEGQTFIDNQNTYGVNALLVFSMACLESGYGRSRYAVVRNNLFGWSAFDSDPDSAQTFTSINQAIQEHMGINLRGYSDIKDFRFFGSHLGNKGSGFNVKYASDPYWGMKIAAIAYSIDKLANDNNGNLTDYDNYSLGVINTYNASVKQSANSSSSTLYTTTYGNNYQENFTVVIRSQDSTWTEIQSTNGINADGSLVTHRTNGASTGTNLNGAIAYDFGRSIGYLPTSQVTSINSKKASVPDGNKPVGDFISKIETFSLYDKNLYIQGYAYQPGIYITDNKDIQHYLLFVDSSGKSTEILLDNSFYNDENYTSAGFLGSNIDITQFSEGEYRIKLKTVHEKYTEENNIQISNEINAYLNYVDYSIKCTDGVTTMKAERRSYDKKYVSSLDSITLNENSQLTINGFAFIQGMDNSKDNIKHQIVFTNLSSNEVVKTVGINSVTGLFDLGLVYNHGYDYSYGWFEGTIDTNDLPVGDYSISIKTTVGDEERSVRLYGTSSMNGSEVISRADGLYTQLKMQYSFSYRVELNVTRFAFIESSKNPLPRIKEAEQTLLSFRYDSENNKLVLSGTALIWNGSFSDSDNAKYTLFMINETTGTINSFECLGSTLVNNETAPWNNTDRINSGFNYDNTWYYYDIILDDFENGDYSFKLAIETDQYIEYIDLKDVTDTNYPNYEENGKLVKGRIDRNNKRKIMLIIQGFHIDQVDEDNEE